MRATIALVSAALVLAVAGVAHASNMFAGPLFPNGITDSCSCDIVNVSSGPKTIEVQILNKAGVINTSGTISLAAGAMQFVPSGVGGAQYCKFINALASNFRATMTCVFNGTDIVTLPAR